MEFKTVTDLEKWFRENVMHINDLFQLKKISQIDFNYRISKLTKQWDKYYKQLTRVIKCQINYQENCLR